MTDGWAYKNAVGDIDIKTVSPNQLAAMVNAIYMNATLYKGHGVPMNHWTYNMIEREFERMVEALGGSLVRVRIVEL